MGGCQNDGPFLGTLNIRGRIMIGIQKGTIILTTNHILSFGEEGYRRQSPTRCTTCQDVGLFCVFMDVSQKKLPAQMPMGSSKHYANPKVSLGLGRHCFENQGPGASSSACAGVAVGLRADIELYGDIGPNNGE